MTRLAIDVRGQRGHFRYHWQIDVSDSGVIGVFGPNGSGKTTLLRALAGLDGDLEGHIRVGEEIWLDSDTGINLPTHQRGVGFVFQDARLLPHLSVRENLRYAAKRSGAPDGQVDTSLRDLGLADLGDRSALALSAGERQRVAIARSLLTRPKLLLLDEPLSANDADRRNRLPAYLRRITRDLGIPAIYVSHSLDEIVALTDTLVLCRDGGALAVGPTAELANRAEVSDLSDVSELGAALSARVSALDTDYGLAVLDCGTAGFRVPGTGLRVGDRVTLQIHARDVAIATDLPNGLSIRNIMNARIVAIDDSVTEVWADVRLDVGDAILLARITRAARDELGLHVGMNCYALIKSASVESNPALGDSVE